MSKMIMIVLSGIGSGLVLQYLWKGIHYKKHGKQKQEISDEIIEVLKE